MILCYTYVNERIVVMKKEFDWYKALAISIMVISSIIFVIELIEMFS